MHYYQFNIGDYASHTRGLALLEDLAYRRIIDEYYLAERPLNGCATDVARLIGMAPHEQSVEYVLTRYFEFNGEAWVHERIENEISTFKNKQEKASKAGQASATARRKPNDDAGSQRTFNGCSTDVERPSTNQEPITNNQEPITKTPKAPKGADDELFAQFWEAYPRKEAKAKAKQAFAKHKPTPELVAAMVAALDVQKKGDQWSRDGGQFIPHATTWLNQERWNDEIAPPRTVAMPMSKSGEHSRNVLSGLTRGFIGGRPDAKLLGK